MSPEEAAGRWVFEVLSSGAIGDLLGVQERARIYTGMPADTMEPEDYPRMSYYTLGPPPWAKGVQRVRVTLEERVWPDGPRGGDGYLASIDGAVVEAFDEAHAFAHSHRLYSTAGGFRNWPGEPGRPLRRTREVIIEVSPA